MKKPPTPFTQLPLLKVPAPAERLRTRRERELLEQVAGVEITTQAAPVRHRVELIGHQKRLGRALINRKLLRQVAIGVRTGKGKTPRRLPTLLVEITTEGHTRLRMLRTPGPTTPPVPPAASAALELPYDRA